MGRFFASGVHSYWWSLSWFIPKLVWSSKWFFLGYWVLQTVIGKYLIIGFFVDFSEGNWKKFTILCFPMCWGIDIESFHVVQMPSVEFSEPVFNLTWKLSFSRCWSLYTNVSVFYIGRRRRRFRCIEGIKVLSLWWIILGNWIQCKNFISMFE